MDLLEQEIKRFIVPLKSYITNNSSQLQKNTCISLKRILSKIRWKKQSTRKLQFNHATELR